MAAVPASMRRPRVVPSRAALSVEWTGDDAVPFGRRQRGGEHREHCRRGPGTRGRQVPRLGPVGGMGLGPGPEPGVFFAGAGQDGDEPSAAVPDVAHRRL
jgi:hypothetical protein